MNLDRTHLKKIMQDYHIVGASISVIDGFKIKETINEGYEVSGTDRRVNDDSIFNLCSISKFLSALLTLKLLSDGILNLDQNVNEILKSWKVAGNEFTQIQKVTLRNLLSHQSGFIDPHGSFEEYSQRFGVPSMVDILEGTSGYCSTSATVEYLPASDFNYSDKGYCLIELLLTEVTGMRFQELMKREIFDPLGLNNTKVISIPMDEVNAQFTVGHTRNKTPIEIERSIYPFPASAGIWSTSKELANVLIEVFDLLRGSGTLKISTQAVSEMICGQGCKPWSGLGVFLDTVDSQTELSSFGWGTGYQCMFVGYPHMGKGAIILTNSDTGVHQLRGFIGECVKELNLA